MAAMDGLVSESSTLGSQDALDPGAATAEAGPAKFHKGSARMFRSDFFEWFSHVHPAMPAIIYLPLSAFVLVLAARAGAHAGALALRVFVGYFAWTLTEYWLHRLLFHLPVTGPKTQKVYFYVHGVHHDWPWDMSRLVIPPGASVALCVIFFALFRGLFGAPGMYPYFAGFMIGYVAYDSIHWLVHARAPRSAFFKWLRKEHMVHHFKAPNTRFGVSCPWWDIVFRTTG